MLLHVLVHVLGVAYIRNDLHFKLAEVGHTLYVLADALCEPFLVSFTYNYKEDLHFEFNLFNSTKVQSICVILVVWRIIVKFASL